jgi:hypothetical protein
MSKLSKLIFALLLLSPIFFNVGPVFAQSAIFTGELECALKNPKGGPTGAEQEGACRSVSIFVILLLKFAAYLFTIVGALALLFFIYGGFTLILSRGSPDAVKKGKDILVASIIGLVIVFGAYMLVRFLGDAVGLEKSYKLLEK